MELRDNKNNYLGNIEYKLVIHYLSIRYLDQMQKHNKLVQ